MRINGLNICYYVEIKKFKNGILVTAGDLNLNMTSVLVSKKDFKKAVDEVLK